MTIEIKVPSLPESVSDGTISKWYKKPGEPIKRDEHLVDIETDKVVLEVVAPADGSLESIVKKEGETVKGEEVIGLFNEGAKSAEPEKKALAEKTPEEKKAQGLAHEQEKPKEETKEPKEKQALKEAPAAKAQLISPAVRRLASENSVDVSNLKGSGERGEITKEDILKAAKEKEKPKETLQKEGLKTASLETGNREEKRVPMSRLRARIAERLLQVQQTAAILTTFNEINMKPVMDIRAKHKEIFEKDYGVRLGFMSFFTIAVVEALKRFPVVNASIDGNDIIYHGYFDIGIAVSSPRGLVVPVIRDADRLDMAGLEKEIAEFAEKAKNNQLSIEDITGGTFTISNGGVFGSLMSTPILNPPQSAILGMHKIQERPVVENGQIVIRPMMYVAMSYDHRLIDGAESVRFLVTIKELLEDPSRLLLNV